VNRRSFRGLICRSAPFDRRFCPLRSTCSSSLLRCGISILLMSQMGHSRPPIPECRGRSKSGSWPMPDADIPIATKNRAAVSAEVRYGWPAAGFGHG
jgi:hypothetical protein